MTRRKAPWLLALAVALAWGGLLLTQPLSKHGDDDQLVQLPPEQVQGVSEVVLDLASTSQRRWRPNVEVVFQPVDHIALEFSAADHNGSEARVAPERVGDVITLRWHGAIAPAEAPHLKKLTLPLGVRRLQADAVSISVVEGSALERLEVKAHQAQFARGHVDWLSIASHAACADPGQGHASTTCRARKPESGRIRVRASEIAKLDLESADGTIDLSEMEQSLQARIMTTPSSRLEIEPIDALSRLQWQPLTPEREAALRTPMRACPVASAAMPAASAMVVASAADARSSCGR